MRLLFTFLLMAFAVLFLKCSSGGSGDSDKSALVKKRITQKIEVDALGSIPDLKIESIEKINDTIFRGIHTFTNPMFNNKEVRLIRDYYFTENLDSIRGTKDLKTEMKSEGEWVDAGL